MPPLLNDNIVPLRTPSPPSKQKKQPKSDKATPLRQFPKDYKPTPQDVICGRDKHAFNNAGNRRLRAIVSSFLPQYLENTCRKKRSQVISLVTATSVHRQGGYFLKPTDVK